MNKLIHFIAQWGLAALGLFKTAISNSYCTSESGSKAWKKGERHCWRWGLRALSLVPMPSRAGSPPQPPAPRSWPLTQRFTFSLWQPPGSFSPKMPESCCQNRWVAARSEEPGGQGGLLPCWACRTELVPSTPCPILRCKYVAAILSPVLPIYWLKVNVCLPSDHKIWF